LTWRSVSKRKRVSRKIPERWYVARRIFYWSLSFKTEIARGVPDRRCYSGAAAMQVRRVLRVQLAIKDAPIFAVFRMSFFMELIFLRASASHFLLAQLVRQDGKRFLAIVFQRSSTNSTSLLATRTSTSFWGTAGRDFFTRGRILPFLRSLGRINFLFAANCVSLS